MHFLLQTGEVADFFRKLFVADDFMARWACGKWTGFHGWVYIISDLMVFGAYFTIPVIIAYFVRKKHLVPFKGVAVLFMLFIFFCGSTHLMDAVIFYYPAYRLNGLLLMCTAVVSWVTVVALFKVLPVAVKMKTIDEMELILNTRTTELQLQKENLEDFAQIVSHNLRSPIASFTSLMELYELKDTPSEKEQIMQKFKQVISRMNRSIDNMSEVVNWQLGVAASEPLNPQAVLNTVLSSLKGQIETLHAEIAVEYHGARTFHYPRLYLESVLLNLLSNALKYSDPSRPCKISIRMRKTRKGLKIGVADNGLGIDLDRYGHKVFDLHQTFHEHPEARGIGLYLVKKHVEQLGGKIVVESEPGKGTLFKLFLVDQKHNPGL